MGFTPQQVGEMSLWQFTAASVGYAKGNGAEEKPSAPSDEEFFQYLEGTA